MSGKIFKKSRGYVAALFAVAVLGIAAPASAESASARPDYTTATDIRNTRIFDAAARLATLATVLFAGAAAGVALTRQPARQAVPVVAQRRNRKIGDNRVL